MEREFLEISSYIWKMKYRYEKNDKICDKTIEDTWKRVSLAVAKQEKDRVKWEKEFYSMLENFKFLPGGRIFANAGTSRDKTTMFNCYVMSTIGDSISGIFDVVKDSALTQKQGGGVGYDFSTIRPCGDHIDGVESEASGPITFMQVLDATCKTIMSAGQRRGAQMGVMRCDHPDIEAFITSKHQDGKFKMFNLSVAVSDDFMKAIIDDSCWELKFKGRVYKTLKARELWDKIMHSTYDYAEPGIIMIDKINEMNNMAYKETIAATNPCGEQPLPPYGACLLGSLNLTKFVTNAFDCNAKVDFNAIKKTIKTAVRFLDNVINISNFPLKEQEDEANDKRRMGIGVTGLGDALIFLGIKYGSEEALEVSEKIMKTICISAYESSVELAIEKGTFPAFEKENYLKSNFLKILPKALIDKIEKFGLRNSHLTSIAPTGTISLLANNVSSGIEPVFAFSYTRKIRNGQTNDDTFETKVMDYAYYSYCKKRNRDILIKDLPNYFVTTDKISPLEHVEMQAALQKYVDSSISKTINVATDFSFEEFKNIYMHAYEKGLKGCTTFRPNKNIMGVLIRDEDKKETIEEKTRLLESSFPKRPDVLTGTTYKIKTPLSPDALYLTINDLIEENGNRRPYELFINTKNLQHFSWIVAMTRLISAVFRKEPDPSFLVTELKSIYDPNGGYFCNGKYVPSLVADIGKVIETHLIMIGIVKAADSDNVLEEKVDTKKQKQKNNTYMICPECKEMALAYQENCMKCYSCGYSKCG